MEIRLTKYLNMIKNKILFLILCLFIIVGIIFRFYNLRYNTQFNWDQENLLAYPARSIIIDHKLTLIGAPTGVGDLRIGPLYSYLAAVVFFFTNMDPIAAPILSGLLSTITVTVGILIIKNITNIETALYFVTFWLLSPFILSFDRTPWNVNLLPLGSVLVSGGLWMVYLNLQKHGWFLAGLGIFIGLNSHFSAIFLIIISLLVAFDTRKVLKRYILFIPSFLILGLAPLFLFNFRHGNLLINNLFTFTNSSMAEPSQILNGFIRSTSLTLETIARLIIPSGPSRYQVLFASILLSVFFIIKGDKKFNFYKRLLFIFLVTYILGFSFYKRHIPDYYLLGIVPIFALGLAQLTYILVRRSRLLFIPIILLLIFFLYDNYKFVNKYDGNSLGYKQAIVQAIKKDAGDMIVDINYDMEFGWGVGYNYLFDYYNIKKSDKLDKDNMYWISYPKQKFPGKPDFISGDLALGFPATSQKIWDKEIKDK